MYLEALQRHVVGQRLERLNLLSPFVLRSVDPPIDSINGQHHHRRAAHRQAASCWSSTDDALPRHPPDDRRASALARAGTEAGHGPEADARRRSSSSTARCSSPRRARRSARRCSWCAASRRCAALDPGGIEPLDATLEQFHDALTRENHTLKRALTDPHLFSGIGNAYSDEILHAAQAVAAQADALADATRSSLRLYDATRATLRAVDRSAARRGRRTGFPRR